HTKYSVCDSRSTCIPYWKYLNRTQIPSEVFLGGEPNNKLKFEVCLSTFPDKGSELVDLSCSGFDFTPVCRVNSKKADDANCTSRPFMAPCFGNDDLQVSFPTGHEETATCTSSNGSVSSVTATCLGKPYEWFYSHSLFGVACRVCDALPKCSEAFPNIPCADLVRPSKTEFYEGESVEYTCVASGQTVSAICSRHVSNTDDIIMEWEAQECEKTAFYDHQCYYAAEKATGNFMDAEMYCQNATNGHLAEPTGSLLSYLEQQYQPPSKTLYLFGPHHTDSLYNCGGSYVRDASCLEIWKYSDGSEVPAELFGQTEPNNRNKSKVGNGEELIEKPRKQGKLLEKGAYSGRGHKGQTVMAICRRHVSNTTSGDIIMEWEAQECDETGGVMRLGGECFLADPTASNITNWLDAEKFCQSKWRGHLAQPGARDFLEVLSAHFNLTTNATVFLGSHITYNQSECNSRETCGPLWKYANGTHIPMEFFADNEPGNQGMEGEKCLSAVFVSEEAHLADETCGYQPDPCKTSPFASLCGGFSEGPLATYERNTEETALCSDGSEIKATCLGDPFQWYYSGNLSNSCDLCNVLPKCSSPPAEILCTTGPVLGNRTEFLSGETVPYTCLGSELTIWAVCNNGTWEQQTCSPTAIATHRITALQIVGAHIVLWYRQLAVRLDHVFLDHLEIDFTVTFVFISASPSSAGRARASPSSRTLPSLRRL
ncbi:unnamed protein product, partial [Cyprideis torosa]